MGFNSFRSIGGMPATWRSASERSACELVHCWSRRGVPKTEPLPDPDLMLLDVFVSILLAGCHELIAGDHAILGTHGGHLH